MILLFRMAPKSSGKTPDKVLATVAKSKRCAVPCGEKSHVSFKHGYNAVNHEVNVGIGGMAQVVELWLCKGKVLSSNSSPTKKKKKTQKIHEVNINDSTIYIK
jgi:hypothetical protein